MARGGHPLRLIEYMIENSVKDTEDTADRKSVPGFLPFQLHKFGIFWNLHQPKRVPTSHFHQPKGF